MKGTGHIASLDAVRGMAALLVCLFHSAHIQYHGAYVVDPFASLGRLINGHGAVVMFFVLSGAVLRFSLERRAASQEPLAADFLISRFFRLYPTVIAAVLIYAIGVFALRGVTLETGAVIRNALLIDVSLIGAFWTLQIEVIGSLLVLIAFALERKCGLWAVMVLAVVLLAFSFAGASWRLTAGIDVALLSPFLVGYLVACMTPERVSLRLAPWLLYGAVIVFFGANLFGTVLKQWMLIATVLASAVIVLVLSSAAYRDSLSWTPLRLLGLWSYSFYALHGFGVYATKVIVAHLPGAGMSIPVVAAIVLLVPAILTIIFTPAFYLLVERPGMALGARIRRWNGRRYAPGYVSAR